MPAESVMTGLIRALRACIQAEDPIYFALGCDLEELLAVVGRLEEALWYVQYAGDEVALLAALSGLVDAIAGFGELAEAGFHFDDLLVRLVQWRFPRLAALFSLLGVTTFGFTNDDEPETARPRATVDWGLLQTLLTRPEQIALPLVGDGGAGSGVPRTPLAASVLAALLAAPHRLLALMNPSNPFGVLPLPSPQPRQLGTDWANFRAATQNWVSFTIPLPIAELPAPSPMPGSIYDMAPGMSPDASLTLAFHAYQSGTDDFLELWAGLVLGGRHWVRSFDHSPWELQVELADTDLGVVGLRWKADAQKNTLLLFVPDGIAASAMPAVGTGPGGQPTGGAPGILTFTLRRRVEEGQPFAILGSPAGPHLLFGSVAFYLELHLQPPSAELGARLEDLTVVADGKWLRLFGDAIGAADSGLTFSFDLETALVAGQGLRTTIGDASIGAILGIDFVHVVNWTLGEAGCHITIDRVRFRLSMVVDNPGEVPPIRAEVLITASGELGPLQVTIEDVGSWLGYDPTQPEGAERFLGLVPPRGMGLVLDAYPVTGGGFLRHEQVAPDVERYLGALQVKITEYAVSAFGIYERRPGYTSFVIVLGARFPGIQLGFGISLTGIGGVVGQHRCADTDALRLRLGTGAAGNVLFSDDPVANAPALLDDLDAIFPSARGISIVGPTVQLGWLALVRFDLGIIVELPGPSKIVILGSMRAELAAPVLQVRLDVLGVVDFVHKVVEIDASLVNSKLLEIFDLTGDAAFRLSWGCRPYMMLSIGGFHPQFNPESLPFPPLERVAAGFDEKVAGVRVWLRIEGYLAITPNTFQLGSRAEAGVALGSLRAEGFIAFDALIQFRPFYFAIDIAAGFKIAWRSWSLLSVQVRGSLTGPPLTLQARFSFEILFFEISFRETIALGSKQADELQPISSLLDVLLVELEKAENLKALGGDDPEVIVEAGAVDSRALVSPLGKVSWSQRRAPLGLELERFEGVPLSAPQAAILHPEPLETVDDWFSPGTYSELTESEALNQPPFARLQAGGVFGFGGERFPEAVPCAVVPPSPLRIKPTGEQDTPEETWAMLTVPGVVQDAIAGQAAPPVTYLVVPALNVAEETYNVYGSDGSEATGGIAAPDAFQRAKAMAGTALPHADRPLQILLEEA